MKRIKKNDTVIVIAGRSKEHTGQVIRVIDDKVWVAGANLIKKHVKPNPQLEQKGGIIPMEAPIHISNVAIYNETTKKADRVGFKTVEKDGKASKVRYFKSNGELVDLI
ncbi:MAG: 50S ribosomal protein L24 [Legionellales bacterium RIFCSPHIGHO2_12_FULL_35_11]|nr:MAG: 50S ribosomal protein L24 [Legionellales bacterium RIFCSPHIGHO2_12_FULL_35_11]